MAGQREPRQQQQQQQDGMGGRRYFYRRKRVCRFCSEKIDYIDFKDVSLLQSFVPERGRIMPRRITGTCAWHQRKLGIALKRARIAALIPYVGV
ncbi:MAG TPA: 30S ribosomal protein S18 [Acidobacteriota bacterium]|nr:30S ribosomal protein S18 [Acidobacteriota bacterium]